MNYFKKIFCAIFFVAALIISIISLIGYGISRNKLITQYQNDYNILAETIGHTLQQMEIMTDRVMQNSVNVLYEWEKYNGVVPTENFLKDLAKKTYVSNLFVTDEKGHFLVVTNGDPIISTLSLFDYASEYSGLITGKLDVAYTPIIPSPTVPGFPYKGPHKYMMIPNHSKSRILEASLHLDYIAKTFQQIISSDANVLEVGLYTPTGFGLGFLSQHENKTDNILNTKNILPFEINFTEQTMTLIKRVEASVKECPECVMKGVSDGSPYHYFLKTKVSLVPLTASLNQLFHQIIEIFILGILASIFLAYALSRHLVKKLATVNQAVNDVMQKGDLSYRVHVSGNDEVTQLANNFNKMIETLSVTQAQLLDAAQDSAIAKTASQVAHDIRSPLAALNIVTQDLRELPEEQRVLIRSAVQRIDDIANDLATKKNQTTENKELKEENYQTQLLSGIIESIVSEKRVQFRSKSGLLIESKLNKDSYGLFAKIKAVEFKRVLSNLINNAVEAMEGKGNIMVSMGLSNNYPHPSPSRERGQEIQIIVSDNGKGIPADVLPKLMQRGASFGKEGHKESGSGLGLFHASETIKSFYGEMEIKSEMGKGTDVIITLPMVEAPDWFLPELVIGASDKDKGFREIASAYKPRNDAKIIILDDDESIHQVWQNRFSELKFKKENIFNFKTPEDLIDWYPDAEIMFKNSETLFLCDYELLGSEKTGLDVIEELGIAKDAVLITSHFEDADVRERCQRLGVKLIPKNLAGYVPIRSAICDVSHVSNATPNAQRMTHNEHYDAILIDDDSIIHTLWKLEAKRLKKSIKTFISPNDFFTEIENFNKDTKIYVDANLGDEIKGEEVSKEIHSKGFKKIYLATGYDKNNFPEMPWIKDVVGKSPPFTKV